MKRMTYEELAAAGAVATPMTYRQRLRRWADVLDSAPGLALRALRRVELYAPEERAALRADGSPLSVAYADPVLRSDGLASDRLGDGGGFFGLGDRDMHALVCDCRYGGRMRAKDVARRVRGLSHPNPLVRLWARAWL